MKIKEYIGGYMQKYYTLSEVARLLDLSDRTIRNYVKDGKLKGKKIGPQWRFTREQIEEIFEDPQELMSMKMEKFNRLFTFMHSKECGHVLVSKYHLSNEDEDRMLKKIVPMIGEIREQGITVMYHYFYKEEMLNVAMIATLDQMKVFARKIEDVVIEEKKDEKTT